MARVVQRRSNPPYLLIIFVFLFLVATVLAVLQYLEADKARQQLATKTELLDKFATPEVRERAAIQDRLDRVGRGDQPDTLVSQYEEEINQLIQLITGKPTDTLATAQAEAEKAYEEVGTRPGLANAVISAYERIEELKTSVAEWQKKYDTAQDEIAQATQRVEEIDTQFAGKQEQLNQRVAELTERMEQMEQQYKADMQAAREDWASQQNEYEKRIAELVREIQQLELEVEKLQAKNAELVRQLRGEGDQDKLDVAEMLRSPDGEILRVLAQDEVVYINLGAKDQITPGITFAVYPPSGITEDGEGKGAIRVNNVGENTSECIIIESDRDAPIVPGDLIANVAYDAIRTYTFVVDGQFDLYGTGRASRQGAQEVRQLIRRYGADVADELGVNVDFVVLGEEPPRPVKPPETAAPSAWKIYQDQLARYQAYRNVKQQAQQMEIPVLNTNRFLAYMGYSPTKAVIR